MFFACILQVRAIMRPCQWSPVLVICLYSAGLLQSPDPVSGVLRLLFACVWQVWSNCSTQPEESGDCYSFVFCRSGAIVRPCRRSPVLVICFCLVDLKQLFDPVSGVRWLVLARILHIWRNYLSLIVLCLYVASLEQLLDLVRGVW